MGPCSGLVWPTDPGRISLERAESQLSNEMRPGSEGQMWPELRAIKVDVRVRDLCHLALVLVVRN